LLENFGGGQKTEMKSHDDFITTRTGGLRQNCPVKTWRRPEGGNEKLLRFHNNPPAGILIKRAIKFCLINEQQKRKRMRK
jgi:hypothetical protein